MKEDFRHFAFEHLNNTKHADQGILIFNRYRYDKLSYKKLKMSNSCFPYRVPKVGSETVWSLIDFLARRNNFSSYSDNMLAKRERGGENTLLDTYEKRKAYYDLLMENGKKPFTYTKHLNFLDFEEFNATQPIYVNFVREPVQRLVSW